MRSRRSGRGCRIRADRRSRLRAVGERTLRWRTYRRGRTRNVRSRSHCAFGIEKMIVARPQPQTDQRPRIRHLFRLPAVIGLVAAHGVFAGLIPGSRWHAAHIMFADQRFLNRLRALGFNLPLAARRDLPLGILPQTRVRSFTVLRGEGCVRFRVLTGCGMRCGMSFRRGRWACFRLRRGRLRMLGGVRRLRAAGLALLLVAWLLVAAGRGCVARSGALRVRSALPDTDRRHQNAGCAPPSAHGFRAMLLFQRLTSVSPDRPALVTGHAKKTKPNRNWHCNHPLSDDAMPVPVG